MTSETNRVRLGVEPFEDRCTPSTAGGLAALHGNPHAEAAHVRAAPGPAIPIKVAFQCSADGTTMEVSATGFASGLGH
jgi:hypothetical protein